MIFTHYKINQIMEKSSKDTTMFENNVYDDTESCREVTSNSEEKVPEDDTRQSFIFPGRQMPNTRHQACLWITVVAAAVVTSVSAITVAVHTLNAGSHMEKIDDQMAKLHEKLDLLQIDLKVNGDKLFKEIDNHMSAVNSKIAFLQKRVNEDRWHEKMCIQIENMNDKIDLIQNKMNAKTNSQTLTITEKIDLMQNKLSNETDTRMQKIHSKIDFLEENLSKNSDTHITNISNLFEFLLQESLSKNADTQKTKFDTKIDVISEKIAAQATNISTEIDLSRKIYNDKWSEIIAMAVSNISTELDISSQLEVMSTSIDDLSTRISNLTRIHQEANNRTFCSLNNGCESSRVSASSLTCYKKCSNSKMSWQDARKSCARLGGILAEPHDHLELDYMVRMFYKGG